jgi:hypothetical protein
VAVTVSYKRSKTIRLPNREKGRLRKLKIKKGKQTSKFRDLYTVLIM